MVVRTHTDDTDTRSCETCKLGYFDCPGHYGHVELPTPIYHPLFMNQCYQLLRSVCLFCHHFKMPEIIVSHQPGTTGWQESLLTPYYS